MRTYTLIPTISCGEIHFLAERAVVRSQLGKYKSFIKSKSSENSSDDFGFCHTYYNVSNRLVAVEFFPEANLIYNSVTLFDQTAEKLAIIIKSNDSEAYADEYSILSKKLGFCAGIEDEQVVSILVCTSDYYD